MKDLLLIWGQIALLMLLGWALLLAGCFVVRGLTWSTSC